MKIFNAITYEVVEMLRSGAVGVIPTDTIYGLVASLSNEAAVRKIYQLKNRDVKKAVGTIIINDPLQIEHLVAPEHLLRAELFWPGSVSVVMPIIDNDLAYAHHGLNSLPFRVPNSPNLREVLAKTGPLATSSANRQGDVPASTINEAMAIFRSSIDFYVDGGDLSGRKASRLIKILENGQVEELRA